MELAIKGGIGDELSLTVAIRSYKKAYPEENLRVFEPQYPELFFHNPHLNIGNGENGKRIRIDFDWTKRDVSSLGEQYCRQLGVPMDDPKPELFLTRDEFALGSWVEPGTIALAPDAKWPTRMWERWRYAALAERLAGKHPLIELLAYKPDQPLPFARGVYGRPLREVAAILARCELLVCGDTSPMHLAAAVGTPQVVIFGVVPARCRAFPSTYPVEGSDCDKLCDTQKCRRSSGSCLDEVSVGQVALAVQDALNGSEFPVPFVGRR